MPPRHLARRALAFAVDHSVAMVLVTLAFLPFAASGLRLPQPIGHLRTVTCTDLEAPPGWLAATLSEPQFSVLRVCENRLWGLSNGRELIAAYGELRPDGTRIAALTRTAVDTDLNPTGIPDLSAAAVLLVMALIAAAMTARSWPTPGKALVRLRVRASSGAGTAGAHPWRREAIRLGPLLVLNTLPALVSIEPLTWPFAVILGGSAAMALGLIWYYLWPFAHWTGQSRHDRMAGTEVVDPRLTAARSSPSPSPAPRSPSPGRRRK